MARLSFALVLLSVALLSAPAFAADRKLLQQLNIPVTAQCLNLLDNSQIANIPNLNVGVIQAIAGVLGTGGQTPSALFFNSGTSKNRCSNKQNFNNNATCSSVIGPVVLPILGQGTLVPCFDAPEGGNGRKLLQQVNVPVTLQCINLLNNNQILNIPNLNVGIIQAIASVLGGAGQAPSALFFNSGTSKNKCTNEQEFNNNATCGSVVGPVVLPILGQGTLTPCFDAPEGNGRKLLQQVNVPVTAQCLNVLDNNQILNIPNADVQVIGAIVNALGAGGAQAPAAVLMNTGTARNNCKNKQNFNNNATCGSAIGPVVLPILGQAFFTPCYSAEGNGRKLLQQVNVPVTVQCVNLLDNNQIANIPNLNVGVIQAIAAVLGGGGQTPSALFFNSGTSKNRCSNKQNFNNNANCSSIVGPVVLPVLGQGTLTPCFGGN